MTAQTQKITLGIDVSKAFLDVCQWDTSEHVRISNDPTAIKKWLKSLGVMVQIAIEPTSSYHLEVIDQAHALGHEVFLINPRHLAHYRSAVGERNKTDPADAGLLARYLHRERSELRAYSPLSGDARKLWSLIKRRALIVTTQQQIRQGLASVNVPAKAVHRELTRLIERIDVQICRLIDKLGWGDDYRRCLSIPGIGPLNAAALVAACNRGAFSSANAFIAYLGLDVRIRESGNYKGKRKLTKHGEAEMRRLLYCAAIPSRSYAPFAEYHQRQLEKGLSKIAANVILARKLARIAFAILRDQTTFIKRPQET